MDKYNDLKYFIDNFIDKIENHLDPLEDIDKKIIVKKLNKEANNLINQIQSIINQEPGISSNVKDGNYLIEEKAILKKLQLINIKFI